MTMLPSLFFCLSLVLATGSVQRLPGTSVAALEIYLARHGQTDWNAQSRLQGRTDIPLNATGREQASKLAARLKGVRFDAVYSSTLGRSRETAEIVSGHAPIEALPGLCEQGLGKFEGIRLDGSDSARVGEYHRRVHDPDDTLDGGESANQHFQRVQAALDHIRKRHPSGSILIVGHGGTNRMIVRALLSLTPAQADSIRQGNDELYRIDIRPRESPLLWKLITEANLRDL